MDLSPADGDPLVRGVVDLGRRLGRQDAPPEVLADRPDGLVVRVGDLVLKAHAVDTSVPDLVARMEVAAHPSLEGVLVAPVRVDGPGASAWVARVAGRPVTVWPAGAALTPDDLADVPWEHAARLLAALHRVRPDRAGMPERFPPSGGPARVRRGLQRLRDRAGDHPARSPVEQAHASLPAWAQGGAPLPADRPRGLGHGDWHLGQLVRFPAGWRLIDVDDLGVGDPSWDLGRPAAWFAAGVMDQETWWRFLGTYLAEGGPAVPRDDPWPVLDIPARALAVQTAALAVVASVAEGEPLDDVGLAFVDACRRMVVDGGTPPGSPDACSVPRGVTRVRLDG